MITALTDLNIWDGQAASSADSIVFERSKIMSICSIDDVPHQAKTISCGGATALPGLMDAHVHMELDPNHKQAPKKTDPKQIGPMRIRAGQMVKAGITTARDLGGGAWLEISLRKQINSGEILGPRLLCAGQPITSVKGHCHFWGGEARDLEEAVKVMHRQIDHGADLIKIMATGGRMTTGSSPQDTQFDLATMTDLVMEAERNNRSVAAHCHGTAGIELAAKAGVRTIEHCSWVGPDGWGSDFQFDIAQIIATKGAWVSPTINRGWQRMLDNKNQTLVNRLRGIYHSMDEIGIPFIASTDAGIPGVFHHHLPEALNVFSKIAGLGAERTLRTATSAAASALGLGNITGQLKPGLDADILLVDGDPLENLNALTRPIGVWTRGVAAKLP